MKSTQRTHTTHTRYTIPLYVLRLFWKTCRLVFWYCFWTFHSSEESQKHDTRSSSTIFKHPKIYISLRCSFVLGYNQSNSYIYISFTIVFVNRQTHTQVEFVLKQCLTRCVLAALSKDEKPYDSFKNTNKTKLVVVVVRHTFGFFGTYGRAKIPPQSTFFGHYRLSPCGFCF